MARGTTGEMMHEPWTSPDAPWWKRALANVVLVGGGLLLMGLAFADPVIRLWRTAASFFAP